MTQGRRSAVALSRQIVITNRIVWRVIVHAIETHGYDATVKGDRLVLRRLDDVIDLSDAVRGR